MDYAYCGVMLNLITLNSTLNATLWVSLCNIMEIQYVAVVAYYCLIIQTFYHHTCEYCRVFLQVTCAPCSFAFS